MRTKPDFPKPIKIGHRNLWKPEVIGEYLKKLRNNKDLLALIG
jgi:predicted DNA-binding transcriptional regulator AlpA